MTVPVRETDAVADTELDGEGSNVLVVVVESDVESELLGAALLLLDIDAVFDGVAEAEAVAEVLDELD